MLRAAFLWLSEQPRIFRFVRRNGLARTLASRFVAGETIDEAITTLHDLNASNLSADRAMVSMRSRRQAHTEGLT